MIEDEKLYALFAESCLEQLSGIEAAILDLESAGASSLVPKVGAIFRAAHTIKGDAGAVGATSLASLCHAAESVLDAVREGVLPVSRRFVGEVLAVFDVIKTMVPDAAAAAERDVSGETLRLAALLDSARNAPQPDLEPSPDRPDPSPTPKDETGERIRNLSIPARELDVLVDRVGELGIVQARLTALSRKRTDPALRDISEEVERLSALLRDQVLGLRLLPIKVSFPKYRRLVRDASAALGKDVELVLVGETTELDKTVIEQLNTPCIHLLRNAVDHGIEPPHVRESLGKPRRGTITLSAQQQGNDVVITIGDDGGGIDAAKLWQKAVASGRIAADRPMDREAALELIFLPGLSTAETVSAVSGRGVGMDAVREGIAALRGRVAVRSIPGQGTTFTISLPVSLAIIDCLEVALADEIYFLHLDYVASCQELPPDTALHQGRGILDQRGNAIALVCLRHFFGLPERPGGQSHVVIVRRDDGRLTGIVVDAVLGRKQAVLKHLGRAFDKIPGVLGATVTEAGDMALVVDVPALMATAVSETSKPGKTVVAVSQDQAL